MLSHLNKDELGYICDLFELWITEKNPDRREYETEIKKVAGTGWVSIVTYFIDDIKCASFYITFADGRYEITKEPESERFIIRNQLISEEEWI